METILSLGTVLFSLSSAFFLLRNSAMVEADEKVDKFNAPFFVSFITLISYIIMWEGSFLSFTEAGEPLYWTRWLFYGASCTLLMYSIGKNLKFSWPEKINLFYLTIIVMVTGALSAVFMGEFKWIMYIISTVAYLLLAAPILTASKSKDNSANLIKTFVILGWSVFPIVFLFSPAGFETITAEASAWIYLLLDFFTKIVFYLVIREEK
jgi:sensory rhodopsin